MNFLKKLFGGADKTKNDQTPARFLDQLDDKITHTMPITKPPPKEHYIIKHKGEYMIFDSKEDMPEELKAGIEEIETVENISSIYNVIIDGKRYRFNNYHDMPEEIKKVLESKKMH